MLDFLNSVINYFHQYTLADTANVFAIVEGAATVVAAVGAIIAVVITKKIAEEQISLAKKQNDISDKQTEISEKQYKIALFEKRYSVFQNINKIRRYAEVLEGMDTLGRKLNTTQTLSLWVSLQRSEYCLQDKLHFAPNSATEQNEHDELVYSTNELMDDIAKMRKQVSDDFSPLDESLVLFSEELSVEIREFGRIYSLYMFSLFFKLTGETHTSVIDPILVRNQFIEIGKKFKLEMPIMKSIIQSVMLV